MYHNMPASLGKEDWDRIATSKQFQDLLALKKMFIIPALAFFFAYHFALPILVGHAPRLMSTRVVGTVTLGYLFALSQFLVGWLIAWLYLKASAKFDVLTNDILNDAGLKGDSSLFISLLIFSAFIATTLGITYWAAKRSRGATSYFAAGRQINAWQNGFAVAGDFMSAASFLGAIGLMAVQGLDGVL
jgi:uncharacterized membrane protein (DUF485 family)